MKKERKIPSGIEFYVVKPKRSWIRYICFWTDFSPWRVCPFLFICITSISAITFLAVCIGLAMLENVWNQGTQHYIQEDLAEARNFLTGLLPSIENIYDKSKAGSPQRTLLERRIKALKLAIQAIDNFCDK
ncbi:hypothetical protein [Bacillus bingmayongensis]|uniref:hypothetical protein n=1 Tax=Bacillus bingmayongensis TaxID=1150157 RepID=UPI0028BEF0E1|nr:hypothetical protein [Bacillus bingmayongensis]